MNIIHSASISPCYGAILSSHIAGVIQQMNMLQKYSNTEITFST